MISLRHSTIGEKGERLKLYPREVKGPFQKYRLLTAWVLVGLFALLPLVRLDNMPLIQFDIIERRLVLFGSYFWPQDIYRFAPLILAFVILIFAVTALFGRIWCGWGCPQAVIPHFILDPVERLFEGGANKRKRQAKQSFTFTKALIKLLKFLIEYSLIFLLVNLFFSYFLGVSLIAQLLNGGHPRSFPYLFLSGIAAGFGLVVFGWFREQACIMVCPYARFLSVLLDEHSLIIGYDEMRGEKRGNPHKIKERNLGDCIDCRKCTKVCPTGIDIRDGLQLECIGCAKCIDTCNSVMRAWRRPEGLIRYSSLNLLKTGTQKNLRPRLFAYSFFILALAAISVIMLAARPLAQVDVFRSVGKPYFLIGENTVSNVLSLRIRNNSTSTRTFKLSPHKSCVCKFGQDPGPLVVEGGITLEIPVNILMPDSAFRNGKTKAFYRLESQGNIQTFKIDLPGPIT